MDRLKNLNPYERHKLIINEYVLTNPGRTKLLQREKLQCKTDIDVIRENHKFLWEEDDVAETWEQQLSKRYYDKLFKEYCIADLSRYKENKIALRWRIEKEVITGKGQFICGNKICKEENGLRSWEVNFGYTEDGEKKNALVKLRLCPVCSDKLNYHSKKREVKRLKKQSKKDKKPSRSTSDSKDNEIIEGSTSSTVVKENSEDDDMDNDDSCENKNEDDNETSEKDEEADHWRKSIKYEEPTREEEFERYLEDLLL